jgi:putative hydrolase of the HAD superfamily
MPPGKFKAVLFDLDDTLITDDSLTEPSWRAVCAKYAPVIGVLGPEELYQAINLAAHQYWNDPELHREGRQNLQKARRQVVKTAFSSLGLNHFDLADEIADLFTSEKEKAITLNPGALDVLKYLKQRDLKLGLLTNGNAESQRKKIKRFDLESIFDSILIEGEFGVGKPDKSIFLCALNRLNTTATESQMVGDDLQRDIDGAARLGILTVWVDWRVKGLPPETPRQPDRIINQISQLIYKTDDYGALE